MNYPGNLLPARKTTGDPAPLWQKINRTLAWLSGREPGFCGHIDCILDEILESAGRNIDSAQLWSRLRNLYFGSRVDPWTHLEWPGMEESTLLWVQSRFQEIQRETRSTPCVIIFWILPFKGGSRWASDAPTEVRSWLEEAFEAYSGKLPHGFQRRLFIFDDYVR